MTKLEQVLSLRFCARLFFGVGDFSVGHVLDNLWVIAKALIS